MDHGGPWVETLNVHFVVVLGAVLVHGGVLGAVLVHSGVLGVVRGR